MSRRLSIIAGMLLFSVCAAPAQTPSPDAMKAARGLVKELNDPYSELFTPRDLKTFQSRTGGRYGGLGMLIEQDPQAKVFRIVTVYQRQLLRA